MKHDFLDKFSDADGFLHRRDARVKIVALAAILLALNVFRSPPWYIPAAAAAVLVAAVAVARLPLFYVFRRAALVLPFALVVGIFLPFTTEGEAFVTFDLAGHNAEISYAGASLYAALVAKAYLSLAFVALLLATTPFRNLMKGLAWFRVPSFLLALLSFTYRYVFVFVDELERFRRAWAVRYFGRRPLAQFLALGPAVGALFVRGYERAERVWAAMLSRGYDANAL
ncbi:MAG: cobalt ECF transporter T component CbiQ [candidate division Zixibacteria bacterium]|nr:cobalt ECF transporter T component CbiQ [candidate division Zixibacteria bacterium]